MAARDHCALRAPTMFSIRMKSASVWKTRLWLTPNRALGFYPRSPIARGYVFHPRTIGDPRGRDAVRASADDFSSAQHRNPATTAGAT
jgi:hypothetical protein